MILQIQMNSTGSKILLIHGKFFILAFWIIIFPHLKNPFENDGLTVVWRIEY